MDLVRKRIDEEFANSEYWVTKHIICDLEMKATAKTGTVTSKIKRGDTVVFIAGKEYNRFDSNEKRQPYRGKVIAVGNGRTADDGKVTPLTVKVGDEILYGKYSGTELNLEGKDYMIMRESDIYAILN